MKFEDISDVRHLLKKHPSVALFENEAEIFIESISDMRVENKIYLKNGQSIDVNSDLIIIKKKGTFYRIMQNHFKFIVHT